MVDPVIRVFRPKLDLRLFEKEDPVDSISYQA